MNRLRNGFRFRLNPNALALFSHDHPRTIMSLTIDFPHSETGIHQQAL